VNRGLATHLLRKCLAGRKAQTGIESRDRRESHLSQYTLEARRDCHCEAGVRKAMSGGTVKAVPVKDGGNLRERKRKKGTSARPGVTTDRATTDR